MSPDEHLCANTTKQKNFPIQFCKLARTASFIEFIDWNSIHNNFTSKNIVARITLQSHSHQTNPIACMSDYLITLKILQTHSTQFPSWLWDWRSGVGGSVSRMSLCRTYCLAISSSKDTIEPLLAIIIHNQDVSDTHNVFLNFGQDS